MTPLDLIHAGAFALGAIVGSFANVCIHRMPRGESVVSPPSRCPRCGERIAFYDNVPILSWLLLRGRCRRCGSAISFRYPLVEGAMALLFLSASLAYGPTPEALAAMLLGSASLILVATDLESRILPDEVTLGTLALGLLLAGARDVLGRRAGQPFVLADSHAFEAVLGAALGAGFLLAVRAAYEKLRGMEGMGLGDVKMIAMIGALTGPVGTLLALFLASLAGALLGGALAGFRRLSWGFALRRAAGGPDARASVARRRGLLVDADGRVAVASPGYAEIPGAARPGDLAQAARGAARPLAAFVRLARRRAARGEPSATGRLPVDDGGDFFRVLAVRAVPSGGGLLVLLSRADIPFGVFLGAGGLAAFAVGRSLLSQLAPGLPLPARLLP